MSDLIKGEFRAKLNTDEKSLNQVRTGTYVKELNVKDVTMCYMLKVIDCLC